MLRTPHSSLQSWGLSSTPEHGCSKVYLVFPRRGLPAPSLEEWGSRSILQMRKPRPCRGHRWASESGVEPGPQRLPLEDEGRPCQPSKAPSGAHPIRSIRGGADEKESEGCFRAASLNRGPAGFRLDESLFWGLSCGLQATKLHPGLYPQMPVASTPHPPAVVSTQGVWRHCQVSPRGKGRLGKVPWLGERGGVRLPPPH